MRALSLTVAGNSTLIAPLPHNEELRIALLNKLGLLDSPPEIEFDRITQLAADVLEVPIALVSLVDSNRQWFKSCVGLDAKETPRSEAFCAHAILADEPLIVGDTLLDARFAENPLVLGAPHIRFYAGIPLLSRDGLALGTLCIIDRAPRALTPKQVRVLKGLADLVRSEIFNRELAQNARAISQESHRMSVESESRFRATFEQAAVGIAIVDLEGHWIDVNQKLCSIVGYAAEELLPITFQEITHPDDLDADMSLVQQTLAGAIDNYSIEKRYIQKNGSYIWINLTVALMRDEAGRPLQFISVIEDIHARKQAEQALRRLRQELEHRVEERTAELKQTNTMLSHSIEQQLRSQQSLTESESQLRAVLENAQDAYVSIDQDGLIAHWNRQAEVTFGWTRDEAIGRRLEETIIPAAYREAHRRGVERYLAHGEAKVLNKRIELNAIRRDGSIFPVEVRISPLPAQTGHWFCAFLHDISERKHHEEALRATQQQLHTIANNLPIQIAYVDAQRTVRFINDTYRIDTGLTPEFALGKKLDELLKSPFYEDVLPHITQALSGERVVFETKTHFWRKERIWSTVYIPDFIDDAVVGFYIMSQDITARKEIEYSLHHKATRDALTGLPNRAALLERLHTAAQRMHRSGEKYALFFLDLDGFKAVNDQYGHESGDNVLKQFAKRLTDSVRNTDLVARLAGDEFVILVEALQSGSSVAEKVGEKILQAMQNPFAVNGIDIVLGVSVGLCMCQPDTKSEAEQLLAFADQAMYEAKRRGKNQLCRFDASSLTIYPQ